VIDLLDDTEKLLRKQVSESVEASQNVFGCSHLLTKLIGGLAVSRVIISCREMPRLLRIVVSLTLLALASARASIGGSMGGRSLEDGSGSHMIPEATSWNEGTIRPPASEVPSASPRGFAVRKRPWDEATTAATLFGDADSFGGAHGSGGAGRMARSGSCMAAAAGISMAFIETEASAADLEEGRQNVYVHVHVHAAETPASLRAQIAAVRESTREIEAEAQRIEEEEAAAIEAGQHAQRQAAAAYAASERAARAARAASVKGPKMRPGATEVTAEATEVTAEAAAAKAVTAAVEEATAAEATAAEAAAAEAAAAEAAAEAAEATAAAEEEATAAEATVAEAAAVEAEEATAAVEATAEAEEAADAAISVAAASEAEADGGRGDDASRGGGGGGSGGGGSDDGSGGGSDDDDGSSAEGHAAHAAHGALLARVAELRVAAKGARRVERWADALAGYAEACSLLEGGAVVGTVATVDGAQAEATSASMAAPSAAAAKEGSPVSRRIAAELQACRLSGALCAYQLEQWTEVIRLCSSALRVNPSCAAALYRRGLALQADGQVEAAAWDLQQAARLQPNNAKHKAAAARAEAAAAAARPLMRRGSLGAHHGAGAASGAGGSSIDEMMQQMMSSLGGSGGAVPGGPGGLGAGGLGALLGGLGAVSGAGGAAGAGGLMSLLGSGLSGAAAGGAASEDGPSPLEALLRSPLLSASGLGGKGTSRMMGLLARALMAQRVAKRLYRRLKPFLPFLFWFAVLLPVLITFRQQLVQLAPWKWVTQYVPAGLLPASHLGGSR
jgi:hypothetical protein